MFLKIPLDSKDSWVYITCNAWGFKPGVHDINNNPYKNLILED